MSIRRSLVLGLALACVSSLASARDATVSFTVANQTGHTLTAFYAGPSSSDDWGDNALDGVVGNGDTVVVTLTNPIGCEYDFRYEFTGLEAYDEFRIDVCAIDGDSYTIK